MKADRDPSPARALLAVLATSFGFVAVQLDVTIVNVALPQIGRELAGGVAALQWVVDAYTLAFAVLLLSAGVLGDRLGARRAYLVGFATFALASAGCGAAPDMATLIAARALQGLGAALLVPTSLALLNHAFGRDPAARAKAVGIWTAAGGVSIAAGPVVGGLLLASLGWRSIFLVNLPVCALGGWLTWRLLSETPRPARARHVDLPGQLLAILALGGLVGGVIEAGRLGLAHPAPLAAFGLFAVAGAAFAATEQRAAEPMLPLGLFAQRAVASAIAFGVIVNLAYYGSVFVLSLYLQAARGFSPLQAGLAFLPLTGAFIVSNLISGPIVARFGSRPLMTFGAGLAGLGYALLLGLGASTPVWAMLPAFAIIPLGMGLAVPAMTTAILASAEPARAGLASGVLNAARQAGGAMGVALFGALTVGGARVIPGLHAAAIISTALLLAGGALAWVGLRKA